MRGFFYAVATPKQIRELMKVDGLTNDEVKSHLQVTVLFSCPLNFRFHELGIDWSCLCLVGVTEIQAAHTKSAEFIVVSGEQTSRGDGRLVGSSGTLHGLSTECIAVCIAARTSSACWFFESNLGHCW